RALARGNVNGGFICRIVFIWAGVRQASLLWPAAQPSLFTSNIFLQATGLDTSASVMPSAPSQAAMTAACTSLTWAADRYPSAIVATPLFQPACCSPTQLMTGTREKIPSKSDG